MVAASTQAAQESNLIPTEIWGSWPRAKTTLASRVLVGVLRKAWLCCWPWFKTIIINNNKRLPFCCSGCFVCVSYSVEWLHTIWPCSVILCTCIRSYHVFFIYSSFVFWLCLLYNVLSSLFMLALQFTFFSGYACFTMYLLLWLCLLYNLPSSLVMLALQFTFFSG